MWRTSAGWAQRFLAFLMALRGAGVSKTVDGFGAGDVPLGRSVSGSVGRTQQYEAERTARAAVERRLQRALQHSRATPPPPHHVVDIFLETGESPFFGWFPLQRVL